MPFSAVWPPGILLPIVPIDRLVLLPVGPAREWVSRLSASSSRRGILLPLFTTFDALFEGGEGLLEVGQVGGGQGGE